MADNALENKPVVPGDGGTTNAILQQILDQMQALVAAQNISNTLLQRLADGLTSAKVQ